jgi:hypothetical protein
VDVPNFYDKLLTYGDILGIDSLPPAVAFHEEVGAAKLAGKIGTLIFSFPVGYHRDHRGISKHMRPQVGHFYRFNLERSGFDISVRGNWIVLKLGIKSSPNLVLFQTKLE